MELDPPVHGGWSDGRLTLPPGRRGHPRRPPDPRAATRGRTSPTRPRTGSRRTPRTAARPGRSTGQWTSPAATTPAAARSTYPKVTGDFDFLVGRWHMAQPPPSPALGEPARVVRGRRPRCRLTTYFDGAISFDEGWFPTEGFRGATLRLYNPTVEDLVDPLDQQPPRPTGDPGHRLVRRRRRSASSKGPDVWEGRPIDVRFIWTPGVDKASWEQFFSTDGGKTWVTNWKMAHTRI